MSNVDKIKKEQEAEGKTKVNNSLLNNSVEEYNNDKHPKVIDVDKAIIVSDIHIGYEKSNVVAFTKFLERIVNSGNAKDYSLFIIGDLWDYWRKHDVIFSSESDMVLALINQFKELYYIPGNHDHITLEVLQNYPDFNCYNISKHFRIRSGEKNFFLLHGHELEVISRLTHLTIGEYDKICDQLCRMNDQDGKLAGQFHEMFHRIVRQRQPHVSDLLQPAESRQGMDVIDKFARSKAKYLLLGMQLNDILIFGHTHRPYNDPKNMVINTGAWLTNMLVPEWFNKNYGQENACSGWYVEINKGEYMLSPYGIHLKTHEEEKENYESKDKERTRREGGREKLEQTIEGIIAKSHSKAVAPASVPGVVNSGDDNNRNIVSLTLQYVRVYLGKKIRGIRNT